jgi:hypothetical protein
VRLGKGYADNRPPCPGCEGRRGGWREWVVVACCAPFRVVVPEGRLGPPVIGPALPGWRWLGVGWLVMTIDYVRLAFTVLDQAWGEWWVVGRMSMWVATRRWPLSDAEVLAGLEASVIADDPATLHGRLGEQRELEYRLLGRDRW